MAVREIRVEMLLGRRVRAANGQVIGHLEEIKADLHDGACFVEEFHVGSYAVFERLAAWSIGRTILKLSGAREKHKGYRIPWDKLDLSDPERPRLLCSVKELETIA
jgi:sporulation protein YlmC with PRC-barrel domain